MAMSAPVVDILLTPAHAQRALHRDALLGLTSSPKWLPPKWFYDARGSDLFEEITRLPEYYPTEAERKLLHDCAPAFVQHTKLCTLIELGAATPQPQDESRATYAGKLTREKEAQLLAARFDNLREGARVAVVAVKAAPAASTAAPASSAR